MELLDLSQKHAPANTDVSGNFGKANLEEIGVFFACWTELTVNKKERRKYWMVLEKSQLTFWNNEDKVGF